MYLYPKQGRSCPCSKKIFRVLMSENWGKNSYLGTIKEKILKITKKTFKN